MSRQQYALRARTLIELVAVGLVVAATAGTISSAVDWGAYVVRAVPVLAAVILSRRFGVALPGKGYASFVLGVMLAAQMLDGWRLAVLTGAVGLVIGDALLRQVVVRSALSTAAHLVFGTALAGLFYDTLGGRVGEAALATANLLPLIGYAVVLPLIVNGTFYLELALREFFAWNDARLTLRWETAVYATSVGLALGWTAIALFSQTFTASIAFVALLVGGTLGMHWLISMGVRADELRMVQGIAGAVATEVSIDRSFARIQEFTHRLVPWTAMGFARYVPESHEMELVADTEMPSGTRFGAGEGLTGDAVRTQRPVVATRGERHDELMERAYTRRSEVLLPLFQGDHLVGLWSVRHREHALYRAEDGALLNLLAPQLALSLSLTAMVSPVVQSSDRATAYARDVAAAVSGILGRAETVAGTASRAQSEAELAAGRVGQAVTRLDELVAGVRDTLITAERTQEATRAMADRAVSVRTANAATAETLEELGATVGEGASEVAHLRDAAQEVETFAETIATIASQTNLLALNATIEASRAGVHGRGFGVVADEVRKLAAESAEAARRMGRSSEATRRVLDRAARLLEEIAERLGEAASRSTHWRSDLDAIVETAEQTRAAGERMASVPRANLDLAEQTNVSLGEAQQAAAASAQEAAAVARLASDQRVAVETLVEGARELRAAAERLAAGVRFIDGGDASGNTS